MRTLLASFLLAGPCLAQVSPAPSPPQNPFSPEKALLGKALFWDEQLSSTGMTACGTCHILEAGGADPRSRTEPVASTHPGIDGVFGTIDDIRGSQGVIHSLANGDYASVPFFGVGTQVTQRNAPSVINSGFPKQLFLDGRAGNFFPQVTGEEPPSALESQALEPPVSSVEMGHAGIQWSNLESRLPALEPLAYASAIPGPLAAFIAGKTYDQLFALAFDGGGVTSDRVVMALATYQRTLVSNQIIQRQRPLTPLELEGSAFFDGLTCGRCHHGSRFTDDQFHNIHTAENSGDPGLGGITGDPEDLHKLRTPPLHNVALTAPYFHDGSAATLFDVVQHYNIGLGSQIFETPLNLGPVQIEAIIAYMRTFTDLRVADGIPPFDRPRLFSESNAMATHFGSPTPRLGIAPEMIALEPPSLRNPNFTLAVRKSIAGGAAVLLIGPDPLISGISIYGITAFVDPTTYSISQPKLLVGDGPGTGHASIHFDLTTLAMGSGSTWHAQWAILDPGMQLPLATSATDAVTFTIFP